MNDELSYQNQDLGNINPIKPEKSPEVESGKTVFAGFKIPNDPKIKLIIILGGIVLVLSIISLIVSLSRKGPVAPKRTAPTPTVFVTPLPTENIDIIKMPDNLKEKFTDVNKDINTGIDFNPPQIDPDIGAN